MFCVQLSPDRQQKKMDHFNEVIEGWLKKMGALVIGPGLGDDPVVIETSKTILTAAREMELPLLVDGSGLNFVAKVTDCIARWVQGLGATYEQSLCVQADMYVCLEHMYANALVKRYCSPAALMLHNL